MANARVSLWESGHDESVEVNQRALIDKVLARYSGEFTVFRELLQNSDDSGSDAVEIHFETKAFIDAKSKDASSSVNTRKSLPDLKTAVVHQWTFKNNGMAFREEDWSRLKKIAEGNPDEEKIGAFGVGFYSLFSVTEEPFVTSGGNWMGFYWKDKKDQLFARRGTLPPETHADPWTSFEMTLRDPAPIPGAFDFTRFLTSSITFMRHLNSVSVYFDDKRLARVTKDPGATATGLSIPHGLKSSSPSSMMRVAKIQSTPLHIKAEVMRWVYTAGTEKPPPPPTKQGKSGVQNGFFSSLLSSLSSPSSPQRTPIPLPVEVIDPLSINESSVVLSIFSADVDVHLDNKIEQELQRSTKKKPPKKLTVDLIYTGKDEYDASKKEDEVHSYSTGSIFQGLRADLDGTGSTRVFIGHATGQTTGLGGHIAARFIPTVERESIDLMDRNVAQWNRELLYVGGFLARCAYELEIAAVRNLWEGAAEASSPSNGKVDPELKSWLSARCLHALKFFTFHPSTPSAVVSNLLQAAFFACSADHPFALMSSVGVRNASEVRMPDPAFEGFLKQLPVLPDEMLSGAKLMVETLRSRGLVKDITFLDVLTELRSRPLTDSEAVACLKWWAKVYQQGATANIGQIRGELLNAAVLTVGTPGGPDEKITPLSSIQTFINPRNKGLIPLDGPIPDHTLPFSVSKSIPPTDLLTTFPWKELSVVDWLRHLTDVSVSTIHTEYDITKSAQWSEQVLNVVARAWSSMDTTQQGSVIALLREKTCIPTRAGMKTPDQAYFANANIFPDLPIVTMPKGSAIRGPLEQVLQVLGVRRHVELQLVFDRMIKTGDWTISDLTKYLVTVQSTLTPVEIDRLRKTAVFPREITAAGATPQDNAKYKAGDLYEPLDIFRELGLPIIGWGAHTKWRGSSEEAKFLYQLGLQRYPPLKVILDLAASQDATTRPKALEYFLSNSSTRYPDYDPKDFSNIAFVPSLDGDVQKMSTPNQVYVDPDSSIFGFCVVHPSIRNDAFTRLKLTNQPPTQLLVQLLESRPPQDHVTARRWFEVLAGRIPDFSTPELVKISQMPIVPIKPRASTNKTSTSMAMLSPSRCYLGNHDSSAQFHSKLFIYVDFGARGNSFLVACGSKPQPSVDEIAQQLVADPRKFYELAEGRENFLVELRNIAVNRRLISSNTRMQMRKSPIFLGSRRVKASGSSQQRASSNDLEEEEWDLQYDLMVANRILIADDTNSYQLFGDCIFVAPQEDLLEEFYIELGSSRLSLLVREEYKTTGEIKDHKAAAEIRSLILERLPLFLHEHTYARTRVQYNWLNNERNFLVKTFGKLTVARNLRFADVNLSRNQDASAVAKRVGQGPIQLWLAGHTQVDMYEVSTSLCRLLFETPKANDALLFMTILSTDLRALRRRGYNVDRILKQQKAEREAAEDAARAKAQEMTALVSDSLPRNSAPPVPVDTRPSTSSSPPAALPPFPEDHPNELVKKGIRPPSSILNPFRDWRQRLKSRDDSRALDTGSSEPSGPTGPSGPSGPSHIGPNDFRDSPGATEPVVSGPDRSSRPSQPTVTPLSNIKSNINMAIAACKQEQGHLLHNRQRMQMVKESLDEGYCDISGQVGDLINVGVMGDIKVFVARDVEIPNTFMKLKHDTLARFSHVILPLREVYGLAPTSVHIFYDHAGGLIAFNRNASLFLNLRYYEAWHDQDVRNGNLAKAWTSWYFTLAHEIAHNLVQPHNSEHEFYFSSICEEHIMTFQKLLAGSTRD